MDGSLSDGVFAHTIAEGLNAFLGSAGETSTEMHERIVREIDGLIGTELKVGAFFLWIATVGHEGVATARGSDVVETDRYADGVLAVGIGVNQFSVGHAGCAIDGELYAVNRHVGTFVIHSSFHRETGDIREVVVVE